MLIERLCMKAQFRFIICIIPKQPYDYHQTYIFFEKYFLIIALNGVLFAFLTIK